MRRKEIEKIPWLATKKGKQVVIEADIVKLSDGFKCLIVDITREVPQLRLALTEFDFENFIPVGSVFSKDKHPSWSRAQLDNINLYGYGHLKKGKTVMSDEVYKKIVDFCPQGYGSSWESAVKRLQREILDDKQEIANERRQNDIMRRMQTVPEYPKGFIEWGSKLVDEHQMAILPFRKSKETKGICSNCGEKEVYARGTIKPKATITCPHCGCKAIVRRIDWENKNPLPVMYLHKEVLLFQKTSEGFVERHVEFWKKIEVGKEETGNDEIGRLFLINGKVHRYFHKYSYYGGYSFWDDRNLYGVGSIILQSGPVYPKNINKKMFEGTPYKYCGMELVKNEPNLSPIDYLLKYTELPEIEMMVKVGLRKLALQISKHYLQPGCKPWDRMGISKKQFNRLRSINGGIKELEWMNYEPLIGRSIDDNVIQWFVTQEISPKKIGFISDRMTEAKIMNYLRKQQGLCNRTPYELLGTWEDYLSMANRLKMNVSSEIFFKPKDLIASHDHVVKLCGGQLVGKRAAEIAKKFPDVDDICKSIIQKYEFATDDYAIVVPEKIEDIIAEGNALGHCLDTSDIYFDRIQSRESYIVFLRKKDEIDKPYYTLEIEPGGATRQKRTTGDKQNKDFDEAKQFIRKWQKEIQKRLSAEDKRLAEISDAMRIKELQELREKNTKIWRGHLAGHLLADVLEADFMAVEEEIRRCS